MWLISLALGANISLAADPYTAVTLGSGGNTLANPNSFGSIISAPSVLALVPRYELEAGGGIGSSGDRRMQGAAVDSTTGAASLGLMFLREFTTREAEDDQLPGWMLPGEDTENPTADTTVAAGLGWSWLNRALSAGLSVVYTIDDARFSERQTDLQVNLSMSSHLSESLIFTVAGRNLNPQGWEMHAPGLASGARIQGNELWGLESDVGMAFSQPGSSFDFFRVGADVVAGGLIPFRVGYQNNSLDEQQFLTTGIGIFSDNASLDYGARFEVGGADNQHLLSLRLRL